MKKITSLCATAAVAVAVTLAQPDPANAITVFDPTNYAQNVLQAARALQQINNQVRSLQNEAQSLLNDARNLTSLPSSVVGELRQTLSESERLIRQAEGLAFEVGRADEAFARAYPREYTSTVSRDRMAADARERWTNSLEALRTATRMQAQVATSLGADERALTDLVSRSQSSVGLLQAVQATNQLLALQAQQSIQDQRLRLAEGRAVTLEAARTVAATERAREVRRRFQGDGSSYTPAPVTLFRY